MACIIYRGLLAGPEHVNYDQNTGDSTGRNSAHSIWNFVYRDLFYHVESKYQPSAPSQYPGHAGPVARSRFKRLAETTGHWELSHLPPVGSEPWQRYETARSQVDYPVIEFKHLPQLMQKSYEYYV